MTADRIAHKNAVDAWVAEKILSKLTEYSRTDYLPLRELIASLQQQNLLTTGWPAPYGDGDIRKQLYLHYAVAKQPIGGLGLTLVSHLDIGARGLLEKGSEALQATWLPGALKGETIFSLAMTEPNAGSDLQGIEFTAEQVDGGWKLNGIKRGITNLPFADVSIVLARTRPERTPFSYTLFFVPLNTAGITRESTIPSLGYSGCLGGFEANDVIIPAENVLGAPGAGLMQLMAHLQTERLFVSARMKGLSDYLYQQLSVDNLRQYPELDYQRQAYHAFFETCVDNYIEKNLSARDSASLKFLGSQLLQTLTTRIQQDNALEDFFADQALEQCHHEAMGLALAGGSKEIMLSIIASTL
ncbi:acyl-CoA dehydrogenase family protein [Teredinibacter sp. KSP-S5-2]|uniref:acyl-CoA dehydrogenase family protein n=1 Tax=Teredinibacter sp. KSP-S5-2 TaxID=3034506 RepID=UPI00293529E1|nr:acyl-CoA dehydrogenase family protein [Teredinibacter sp. KSP-S5-2]WNO10695.1 acyl-CoA dehydrogenase family protein [Teredinibacter sp. KSP-S5-2]